MIFGIEDFLTQALYGASRSVCLQLISEFFDDISGTKLFDHCKQFAHQAIHGDEGDEEEETQSNHSNSAAKNEPTPQSTRPSTPSKGSRPSQTSDSDIGSFADDSSSEESDSLSDDSDSSTDETPHQGGNQNANQNDNFDYPPNSQPEPEPKHNSSANFQEWGSNHKPNNGDEQGRGDQFKNQRRNSANNSDIESLESFRLKKPNLSSFSRPPSPRPNQNGQTPASSPSGGTFLAAGEQGGSGQEPVVGRSDLESVAESSDEMSGYGDFDNESLNLFSNSESENSDGYSSSGAGSIFTRMFRGLGLARGDSGEKPENHGSGVDDNTPGSDFSDEDSPGGKKKGGLKGGSRNKRVAPVIHHRSPAQPSSDDDDTSDGGVAAEQEKGKRRRNKRPLSVGRGLGALGLSFAYFRDGLGSLCNLLRRPDKQAREGGLIEVKIDKTEQESDSLPLFSHPDRVTTGSFGEEDVKGLQAFLIDTGFRGGDRLFNQKPNTSEVGAAEEEEADGPPVFPPEGDGFGGSDIFNSDDAAGVSISSVDEAEEGVKTVGRIDDNVTSFGKITDFRGTKKKTYPRTEVVSVVDSVATNRENVKKGKPKFAVWVDDAGTSSPDTDEHLAITSKTMGATRGNKNAVSWRKWLWFSRWIQFCSSFFVMGIEFVDFVKVWDIMIFDGWPSLPGGMGKLMGKASYISRAWLGRLARTGAPMRKYCASTLAKYTLSYSDSNCYRGLTDLRIFVMGALLMLPLPWASVIQGLVLFLVFIDSSLMSYGYQEMSIDRSKAEQWTRENWRKRVSDISFHFSDNRLYPRGMRALLPRDAESFGLNFYAYTRDYVHRYLPTFVILDQAQAVGNLLDVKTAGANNFQSRSAHTWRYANYFWALLRVNLTILNCAGRMMFGDVHRLIEEDQVLDPTDPELAKKLVSPHKNDFEYIVTHHWKELDGLIHPPQREYNIGDNTNNPEYHKAMRLAEHLRDCKSTRDVATKVANDECNEDGTSVEFQGKEAGPVMDSDVSGSGIGVLDYAPEGNDPHSETAEVFGGLADILSRGRDADDEYLRGNAKEMLEKGRKIEEVREEMVFQQFKSKIYEESSSRIVDRGESKFRIMNMVASTINGYLVEKAAAEAEKAVKKEEEFEKLIGEFEAECERKRERIMKALDLDCSILDSLSEEAKAALFRIQTGGLPNQSVARLRNFLRSQYNVMARQRRDMANGKLGKEEPRGFFNFSLSGFDPQSPAFISKFRGEILSERLSGPKAEVGEWINWMNGDETGVVAGNFEFSCKPISTELVARPLRRVVVRVNKVEMPVQAFLNLAESIHGAWSVYNKALNQELTDAGCRLKLISIGDEFGEEFGEAGTHRDLEGELQFDWASQIIPDKIAAEARLLNHGSEFLGILEFTSRMSIADVAVSEDSLGVRVTVEGKERSYAFAFDLDHDFLNFWGSLEGRDQKEVAAIAKMYRNDGSLNPEGWRYTPIDGSARPSHLLCNIAASKACYPLPRYIEVVEFKAEAAEDRLRRLISEKLNQDQLDHLTPNPMDVELEIGKLISSCNLNQPHVSFSIPKMPVDGRFPLGTFELELEAEGNQQKPEGLGESTAEVGEAHRGSGESQDVRPIATSNRFRAFIPANREDWTNFSENPGDCVQTTVFKDCGASPGPAHNRTDAKHVFRNEKRLKISDNLHSSSPNSSENLTSNNLAFENRAFNYGPFWRVSRLDPRKPQTFVPEQRAPTVRNGINTGLTSLIIEEKEQMLIRQGYEAIEVTQDDDFWWALSGVGGKLDQQTKIRYYIVPLAVQPQDSAHLILLPPVRLVVVSGWVPQYGTPILIGSGDFSTLGLTSNTSLSCPIPYIGFCHANVINTGFMWRYELPALIEPHKDGVLVSAEKWGRESEVGSLCGDDDNQDLTGFSETAPLIGSSAGGRGLGGDDDGEVTVDETLPTTSHKRAPNNQVDVSAPCGPGSIALYKLKYHVPQGCSLLVSINPPQDKQYEVCGSVLEGGIGEFTADSNRKEYISIPIKLHGTAKPFKNKLSASLILIDRTKAGTKNAELEYEELVSLSREVLGGLYEPEDIGDENPEAGNPSEYGRDPGEFFRILWKYGVKSKEFIQHLADDFIKTKGDPHIAYELAVETAEQLAVVWNFRLDDCGAMGRGGPSDYKQAEDWRSVDLKVDDSGKTFMKFTNSRKLKVTEKVREEKIPRAAKVKKKRCKGPSGDKKRGSSNSSSAGFGDTNSDRSNSANSSLDPKANDNPPTESEVGAGFGSSDPKKKPKQRSNQVDFTGWTEEWVEGKRTDFFVKRRVCSRDAEEQRWYIIDTLLNCADVEVLLTDIVKKGKDPLETADRIERVAVAISLLFSENWHMEGQTIPLTDVIIKFFENIDPRRMPLRNKLRSIHIENQIYNHVMRVLIEREVWQEIQFDNRGAMAVIVRWLSELGIAKRTGDLGRLFSGYDTGPNRGCIPAAPFPMLIDDCKFHLKGVFCAMYLSIDLAKAFNTLGMDTDMAGVLASRSNDTVLVPNRGTLGFPNVPSIFVSSIGPNIIRSLVSSEEVEEIAASLSAAIAKDTEEKVGSPAWVGFDGYTLTQRMTDRIVQFNTQTREFKEWVDKLAEFDEGISDDAVSALKELSNGGEGQPTELTVFELVSLFGSDSDAAVYNSKTLSDFRLLVPQSGSYDLTPRNADPQEDADRFFLKERKIALEKRRKFLIETGAAEPAEFGKEYPAGGGRIIGRIDSSDTVISGRTAGLESETDCDSDGESDFESESDFEPEGGVSDTESEAGSISEDSEAGIRGDEAAILSELNSISSTEATSFLQINGNLIPVSHSQINETVHELETIGAYLEDTFPDGSFWESDSENDDDDSRPVNVPEIVSYHNLPKEIQDNLMTLRKFGRHLNADQVSRHNRWSEEGRRGLAGDDDGPPPWNGDFSGGETDEEDVQEAPTAVSNRGSDLFNWCIHGSPGPGNDDDNTSSVCPIAGDGSADDEGDFGDFEDPLANPDSDCEEGNEVMDEEEYYEDAADENDNSETVDGQFDLDGEPMYHKPNNGDEQGRGDVKEEKRKKNEAVKRSRERKKEKNKGDSDSKTKKGNAKDDKKAKRTKKPDAKHSENDRDSEKVPEPERGTADDVEWGNWADDDFNTVDFSDEETTKAGNSIYKNLKLWIGDAMIAWISIVKAYQEYHNPSKPKRGRPVKQAFLTYFTLFEMHEKISCRPIDTVRNHIQCSRFDYDDADLKKVYKHCPKCFYLIDRREKFHYSINFPTNGEVHIDAMYVRDDLRFPENRAVEHDQARKILDQLKSGEIGPESIPDDHPNKEILDEIFGVPYGTIDHDSPNAFKVFCAATPLGKYFMDVTQADGGPDFIGFTELRLCEWGKQNWVSKLIVSDSDSWGWGEHWKAEGRAVRWSPRGASDDQYAVCIKQLPARLLYAITNTQHPDWSRRSKILRVNTIMECCYHSGVLLDEATPDSPTLWDKRVSLGLFPSRLQRAMCTRSIARILKSRCVIGSTYLLNVLKLVGKAVYYRSKKHRFRVGMFIGYVCGVAYVEGLGHVLRCALADVMAKKACNMMVNSWTLLNNPIKLAAISRIIDRGVWTFASYSGPSRLDTMLNLQNFHLLTQSDALKITGALEGAFLNGDIDTRGYVYVTLQDPAVGRANAQVATFNQTSIFNSDWKLEPHRWSGIHSLSRYNGVGSVFQGRTLPVIILSVIVAKKDSSETHVHQIPISTVMWVAPLRTGHEIRFWFSSSKPELLKSYFQQRTRHDLSCSTSAVVGQKDQGGMAKLRKTETRMAEERAAMEHEYLVPAVEPRGGDGLEERVNLEALSDPTLDEVSVTPIGTRVAASEVDSTPISQEDKRKKGTIAPKVEFAPGGEVIDRVLSPKIADAYHNRATMQGMREEKRAKYKRNKAAKEALISKATQESPGMEDGDVNSSEVEVPVSEALVKTADPKLGPKPAKSKKRRRKNPDDDSGGDGEGSNSNSDTSKAITPSEDSGRRDKGEKKRKKSLGQWVGGLLRHGLKMKPKFTIRRDGFVPLRALIRYLNFHSENESQISESTIQEIASQDAKQRFTIAEESEGPIIRAAQGHQKGIIDSAKLAEIVPRDQQPEFLYHGTTREKWGLIEESKKLSSMGREHVHLIADPEREANSISGFRKNSDTIIEVSTESVSDLGAVIYRSDNGVYLVERRIHLRSIWRVADRKTGEILYEKEYSRQ